MLCYLDFKYKDHAEFIVRNVGKHFPYALSILNYLTKEPEFALMELPLYHFCFLKNDDEQWLGLIVYNEGNEFVKKGLFKNSEKGKVFITVLEVGFFHHHKEYGMAMVEWLQEKFPNLSIQLIAKDKAIAENYYLKRGFVQLNPDELVLEYKGAENE